MLRTALSSGDTPNSHDVVKTPREDSGAVQWLTILVFLAASSTLFASLFEWERYHMIAGPRAQELSLMDNVLLFWLLASKTMAWFLPLLPLTGLLVLLGLRRTATVVLNLFAIGLFYIFAIDLVSVGFAGNHIWDWLPYLRDMIAHPDQKLWQWAGEKLTTEALLILAIFAVACPACFAFVQRMTLLSSHRLSHWLTTRALVVLTASLVLGILAVVPALGLFAKRNVLEQIYTAMPLSSHQRDSFRNVSERLATWFGTDQSPPVEARFSAAVHPRAAILARHSTFRDETTPLHRQEEGSSEPVAGIVYQRDGQTALHVLEEAANPGPVDSSACIKKKGLPNVILIIFESFRHHAVSPDLMKKLDVWSGQGLRLQRHFSGSNCSHLGLFSLFYGRSPLGYHETLDRRVAPQMFESLRRSGYRITFLTSGEVKGFRRLDEFINTNSCDEIISQGEFTLKGMNDWPDSDRRKLERVRDIVNNAQDQPQFVFFYLVSSHYRYPFPPEFNIFKESAGLWQFLNPREQIRNHLNRYANSVLFLEHEVMKLIGSIDPSRNIVMITGDHGESMGEDGVFTHASRMSEIQLRVPFIMAGPGIEPRRISTATVHTDVLPTLLHALAGRTVKISHCEGRDLIADRSPDDRVVLVPANGPQWRGMMIVRDNKRLAFRTTTGPKAVPSVEFAGLVDEHGQFEYRVSQSEQARHDVNQGQ